MTLYWDYKKREVYISMIDYVSEALIRFQHNAPPKMQDQPHPRIKKYGEKMQHSSEKYSSPLLGKYEKRFIQEVTGTFLYY